MCGILPGIHSLEQHLDHLQDQPESYRPQRCPNAAKRGCGDMAVMSEKPRRAKVWPLRWMRFSFPVFCVRIAGVAVHGCQRVWRH